MSCLNKGLAIVALTMMTMPLQAKLVQVGGMSEADYSDATAKKVAAEKLGDLNVLFFSTHL